jgi:hypothetical protein
LTYTECFSKALDKNGTIIFSRADKDKLLKTNKSVVCAVFLKPYIKEEDDINRRREQLGKIGENLF